MAVKQTFIAEAHIDLVKIRYLHFFCVTKRSKARRN